MISQNCLLQQSYLEGTTVAVDDDAVYKASMCEFDSGSYLSISKPQGVLNDFSFGLPGRHNLMNALMAIAMAVNFGSPTDAIAVALASFKGVRRRFSSNKRLTTLYIEITRIILQK
jgi:UDP-N-acetylmuramate--alanine ligase